MRSTLLWLRKWFHAIGVIIVFTSSLIIPAEVFGEASAYLVTEVSSAEADAGAVPSKLNNLGDMAGRAASAAEGGTRATIWKHSDLKKKHLRALLGSDYSSASAINDAGEVAGVSNTGEAILPFIWTPTGELQRVPLLPGDNCGQANGINKHGHVVGYSSGPNGAKAFLWTRGKGVQNLGVLPGGNYSRACDINDLDEVAGTSASAAGDRAVLWTKTGTVRDLGTLPGDTSSEASAINNNGDVVGYSKGPRGNARVFVDSSNWNAGSGGAPGWKLQPSSWYQRQGCCGWEFDKLVGRSRFYMDTTSGHERSEQRSLCDSWRSVC